LDQYHHLLINLSCKSAIKPLNANIALEQKVIAAAITIALLVGLLYLHASDVVYTNTTRSTEAEQRLFSEYTTFAHVRSGSRCHLIFERLIHICSW